MARRFKSNWFAVFLQSLVIAFLTISLFLPNWLYNDPLAGDYPYPRKWGLLSVVGRLTRSHSKTMEASCDAAAEHSVGANCTFGVCAYFMAKCAAWRILMIASYAAFAGLSLAAVLNLLAIMVQFRDNTRAIKFAVAISMFSFLLIAGSMAQYFFVARTAFLMVNSQGSYPVPQPHLCWYLSLGAAFCALVATGSQASRLRKRSREKEYTEDVRTNVARIRDEYGV
eukprot:Gregarina_sp_Poly_1__5929@NODE_3121_length_1361_cov_20_197063_g1982_i0_p1_GENE_NODE_3121_length_1361_cov_20_197063_g1982_i0NODE_3121_length_1361_cov_20_197063_g1982_i0_p1_ORF_typecomplete_len226_score19_69L_HMGIC_fpl/PF10242_9/0_00021Claudin_3/PF06653_11/0_008LAB_N/PF07578_11/1_8e03LAB_N/PF07578_11/0_013_NODE_3121_length_1361_cov_20_197063_g1982_i039716